MNLEEQLREILDPKKTQRNRYKLIRQMQELNRPGPCLWFDDSYPEQCGLKDHDARDCLTCSDYCRHIQNHYEQIPTRRLFAQGAKCQITDCLVYHLMEFVEKEGHFLKGTAYCGQEPDEREHKGEIYYGEPPVGIKLCKKCEKKARWIESQRWTQQHYRWLEHMNDLLSKERSEGE